jgi:sarcosine oxidase delta subunit
MTSTTRSPIPTARASKDTSRHARGCDRYVEQIRTTVDLTSEIHVLEERPEVSAVLSAFRNYRRRP